MKPRSSMCHLIFIFYTQSDLKNDSRINIKWNHIAGNLLYIIETETNVHV